MTTTSEAAAANAGTAAASRVAAIVRQVRSMRRVRSMKSIRTMLPHAGRARLSVPVDHHVPALATQR